MFEGVAELGKRNGGRQNHGLTESFQKPPKASRLASISGWCLPAAQPFSTIILSSDDSAIFFGSLRFLLSKIRVYPCPSVVKLLSDCVISTVKADDMAGVCDRVRAVG